ncbi:MAG: hypothetical protein HY690_03720 [Chloroflexi bacterium]|nr:hypothetical protein [Chloroflexota bacterium]
MMATPARSPYRDPATGTLVAGAIYLHVPVIWHTPRVLAAAVVGGGLLQANPDFNRAYVEAPDRLKQEGIPAVARGKPRPVLVLRVGSLEQDETHASDVWVAPRYSMHERPRSGRNLFPLPRSARHGLDEDGYLDFFELASMPAALVASGHRSCDVTAQTFSAIVAALRTFLDPW